MYPEDSKTSWILQLAQFKLAAAAGDRERASDIVAALFRNVVNLPSEERDNLELSALLVVLRTIGVANYVDEWLSLLQRLKSMVEADGFLHTLTSRFEKDSGVDLFGGLFSTGIANLASVRKLEHIINVLDQLDESERELWLTPIDPSYSDYHDIISGPWAQQRRSDQERFEAADVAMRYKRMAVTTRSWRTRSVSLQCSVAQAVMRDEYQNDTAGALRILHEALARVGDDPILLRALANVYFRNGDYGSALTIYRGMAMQMASNLVERAFMLRKAAICASKCGELLQAQEWFLEAAAAARSVIAGGHDMAPIEIGLRADSAVAGFEAGNRGDALRSLADAVRALSDIDPDESLRSAYCHRVVRHSVLWVLSRAGEGGGTMYGTAISLDAGSCSNPEPPSTIRELPLGHIDIVWYMLARIEVTLGIDVGISETFEDRLGRGPIPVMEIDRRTKHIRQAVVNHDVTRFVEHYKEYLEAQSHLSDLYTQGGDRFDPSNPPRGLIPVLDREALSQPVSAQAARDAVIAFGIYATIAGGTEKITELGRALDGMFPTGYPGKSILDHWADGQNSVGVFDRFTLAVIKAVVRVEHAVPSLYWTSGVCFVACTKESRFKDLLTGRLAAWQRLEWQRIVESESFRLLRPQQTVPPIEKVLELPTDDLSFVAKLLLAAAESVDTSRIPGYREILKPLVVEE